MKIAVEQVPELGILGAVDLSRLIFVRNKLERSTAPRYVETLFYYI